MMEKSCVGCDQRDYAVPSLHGPATESAQFSNSGFAPCPPFHRVGRRGGAWKDYVTRDFVSTE